MESRAIKQSLRWLLAMALGAVTGVVGPSCSSGGGRTIPGFGTPCAGNADCAKYKLVCDPSSSKCAECLSDSDCIQGLKCQEGACRGIPVGTGGSSSGGSGTGGGGGGTSRCSVSSDCPRGTVCDAGTGSCVQCVSTVDCAGGEQCIANKCTKAQTCTSSLQCATNLVCDTVSQVCVECLGDNDCSPGQSCVSESCVSSGTGGTGGGGTGGTGGTTGGTGGTTGGTGGATGGTGGTTTCTPGLIDNMDQGLNGAIPGCEGRAGGWYVFHDPYVTNQQPAVTGGYTFPYVTGGSDGGYAVRTTGTTSSSACYDAYGAGMGVTLNDTSGGVSSGALAQPYNASARGYVGVTFYAKARSVSTVAVHFPDRYTDPRGGYCTAATNTCTYQGVGTCYDDWYYTITLGTGWQKYSIAFTSLVRQGTWGLAHAFDPSGMISIQWQFGLSVSFDLYVDDLRFY